MSGITTEKQVSTAGIYSFASTWQSATDSRLSNGYAYCENEVEAKGKAFEVGQKNNPGCSMGGLLVIKAENPCLGELEAGMEEIALALGLVPENTTIEQVVKLVKAKLSA